MKQMLGEKYTIAWFKLADCVAKGEREKALGVYRLLSHSIDDKAYAMKLEGDLLYAFNDHTAMEKYEQAAFLYRQQKQYKEAAALAEELVLSASNSEKYIFLLIDFYKNHMSPDHCISRCSKLLDRLFDAHNVQTCYLIMQELPDLQGENILLLYEKFIVHSLKVNIEFFAVKPYLDKALQLFMLETDTNRLHTFLTLLQTSDEQIHAYALRSLNK